MAPDTLYSPIRRPMRRIWAAPVAGFACVVLLAGCSSGSDTTAAGSDSSQSGPAGAPAGGMGGAADCSDAGTPDTATDAVPENEDAADVASIVSATDAFLAMLSDKEASSVSFDYDDLETKECSWSNFPDGLFNGRVGLRLGDLTDEQAAAAMAIVKSAMSEAGYTYLTEQLEGDNQLSSGDDDTTYGDQNYHLAIYGDPSSDDAWTLQFGGHHVGIMVTVGGDALSVSPYFKGSQPVSYESEGKTVESMGTLADDFFGIFTSMDDTAQSAAKLDGTYNDLVMGPQSDTDYPSTEGTKYADLTTEQQQLVKDVIKGYVGDYAAGLADPLIALYESQLDDTYVSWATGLDQDSAAYMRIDGPRLWLEWVNTNNPGSSGIHYHTIYRDKSIDYGTGTSS